MPSMCSLTLPPFTLSLGALNHADDGCVLTQAAVQPLATVWRAEAIRFTWTHQGTAKAEGLQRQKSPSACCCREGWEWVAGKSKKPPENLPYLQEHLCLGKPRHLGSASSLLSPPQSGILRRGALDPPWQKLSPCEIIHLSAAGLTREHSCDLWPALSMCKRWLTKLTEKKQQTLNFPAQSEIPLCRASSWGCGIMKEEVQTQCENSVLQNPWPVLKGFALF